MQPIHYSLIFNVIALVVCTALAWRFEEPWLVIVALVLAQHTMARFQDDDDDEDDEKAQPMGFLQDVK